MAELSEESKSYLSFLSTPLNPETTPITDLRQRAEDTAEKFKGDFIFAGQQEEITIPGEKSDIPVTVLKPQSLTCQTIMIYFHGGGWTWGSRQSHMTSCEMISQQCNCVVVNVEYRLAPEHKFPACYEDARAAVDWCLAHREELSGQTNCVMGVAGDSAGGNIAAAMCQMIGGLDYQVLIYPSLNLVDAKKYPSYYKYKEGYLLTEELMEWFRRQFLSSKEDALQASPILQLETTSDHEICPPAALFLIAECDPLADQRHEYNEKLKALGVKTEVKVLTGALHGFFNKPGHFKNAMKKSIDSVEVFLESLRK